MYSGSDSNTSMDEFAAMLVTASAGVTNAVTSIPARTLKLRSPATAESAPMGFEFWLGIGYRVTGEVPGKPEWMP